MRRTLFITMAAVLTFAFCGFAEDAAEKRYDLRLQTKHVAGWSIDSMTKQDMNMTMTLRIGEQKLHEEKTQNSGDFKAVRKILEVKDGDPTREEQAYERATAMVKGKETVYGFQGKTVVCTLAGEKSTFTYPDGAALTGADLAGIREVFQNEDAPGAPSRADEMFVPKKPVKVGESWSPNIGGILTEFMQLEPDAADLEKSKAMFTLKSVEKRDGAEFGKIVGTMDIHLSMMGPMKFTAGLPLKIQVDLDVCIDGTRPDGVAKMSMTLKGKTTAEVPGTPPGIVVDMDMSMTSQETHKLKAS